MKKIVAILVLIGCAFGALYAFKPGDMVLGKYNKRQYWYPAKIQKVDGQKVTLMYQGEGVYPPRDEAEETTLAFVKSMEWKAGMKGLQCKPEGSSYQSCDVLSIAGEKATVKFSGEGIEPAQQTVNLVDCMEEQVVPPGKEWTLNGEFRDYDKFKKTAVLPASAMSDVNGQAAGALDYEMQNWDGAQNVKILKCSVTTAWTKLFSGSEHTARYARSACALELEAGKCIVLYGGCYEEYQGNNQYGDCLYRKMYSQESNQIDCKAVK